MPKAPNKYEMQHYKNMDAIEEQIQKLFSDADFELSYFVKSTFRGAPNYTSSPIFLSKVEELAARLRTGIETAIKGGVQASEALSATKSQDAISELTKARKELQIYFTKEYGANTGDPSRYFEIRKNNGFDISQRVFDLSGQRKAEFSDAVGTAIGDGTSADELAKSIQKYLKDPEKVFRRVRDESGKMVDSQVRKNYHPGQGVYKSSKANASRLSRTEINISYRAADNERWQKQDFVKAVDVKLSNSHPECDICNYFVGRYPKDFIFKGWHPSCLCYAVPVLMNQDELDKYEDYVLGIGEKPQLKYETEIPVKTSDYISQHSERINNWKSAPYWVSDNGKYVGDLPKSK